MSTKTQTISEALERLKEVMQGLKDSTDELTDELTEAFQTAQANGGKIPDVNEIARQVLKESADKQARDAFDIQVRKAAKKDLLSGELSAVTIQIGCYVVRSAERVYRIPKPGYIFEKEILADDETLEYIRNERDGISMSFLDEFRITWELSAKHTALPDSEFIDICRAADTGDYPWCKIIGVIPILYDRLYTLATEYDLTVAQLVNAAVKRLLDDVDFVRNLRAGKLTLDES